MLKRFLIAGTLCLVFWALSQAQAADSKIEFELYSWRAGSQWNYAILEGTSAKRPLDVIQSRKNRLKDLVFLKGRIATLPAGETLYWRVDKRRGLLLPPKAILHEISEFAANAQIKLLLPGETSDSKTLEQLQSDVKQMVVE